MNELAKRPMPAAIEAAVVRNDLSKLNEQERLIYYNHVCESIGLNPFSQPFQYLVLNGKMILYAGRACTDQLRALKKISIKITSRGQSDGVYTVTAQATTPEGRNDESLAAVTVINLKGDMLANAYMKCETKAKRRVTLSIAGLGMLDETEVETIPNAEKVAGPLPKAPTYDTKHAIDGRPQSEPLSLASNRDHSTRAAPSFPKKTEADDLPF